MYSDQFDAPADTGPGALIYNPAMQLQLAQHMGMAGRRGRRGQTSMPQAGPGSSQLNPMQQSVMLAKQAMLSGAADLDEEGHNRMSGVASDPSTSLEDFQKVLRSVRSGNKIAAKQPPQQQQAPNPNAGTIEMSPGRSSPNGSVDYTMTRMRDLGTPVTPTQNGFIAHTAPPAAPDPTSAMLAQFKGHVPDNLLEAAHQAIAGGMPIQQAFGHLQTAMQQGQSGGNREQSHQVHQRLADLRRQNSQMQHEHRDIDWGGDEGQFSSSDPTTQQYHQLWNQYKQNETEISGLEGQLEGGAGQQKQQQPAQAQPQQQQPHQQGPAQITDPSQAAGLPSGSEFVFNGHVYRKH